MIVPRHWAESRVQTRARGRQVTVRRFGWSNDSLEDAERMAEERAREALRAIERGEELPRREQKVPYNGAEGLPIREEIVSEHGSVVVTRNAYGARCLNTPDVCIADVDHAWQPRSSTSIGLSLVGGALAVLLARVVVDASWVVGLVSGVVGAGLAESVAARVRAVRVKKAGGPLAVALARLRAFVDEHPTWHVRAYETPAGLRLLVMHATKDPLSDDVARFFEAMHVDRQYVFMCTRQRCFRARLTAKPWRIGIDAHMKPRPGVWPVREERRAERAAWIEAYEETAKGYAAASFIEAFGATGLVDEACERVRALHDEACRAMDDRELA